MTFSKIFLQKCSSGRVNGFSIFSGLSSNSGHPQLEPLKYISFIVPIKREDVAEWASQEAEVTSGRNAPVEPPSWKYGYIIYLKMFYDIRYKWEQATDPVKLQQLYGQMNKSVLFSICLLSFHLACYIVL